MWLFTAAVVAYVTHLLNVQPIKGNSAVDQVMVKGKV